MIYNAKYTKSRCLVYMSYNVRTIELHVIIFNFCSFENVGCFFVCLFVFVLFCFCFVFSKGTKISTTWRMCFCFVCFVLSCYKNFGVINFSYFIITYFNFERFSTLKIALIYYNIKLNLFSTATNLTVYP